MASTLAQNDGHCPEICALPLLRRLLRGRLALLCLLELRLCLLQLLLGRHVDHHEVQYAFGQHSLLGLCTDPLGAFLGLFTLCTFVSSTRAESGCVASTRQFGGSESSVVKGRETEEVWRIDSRLGFPPSTGEETEEVHVCCIIWVCVAGSELRCYRGHLSG